MGQRQSCQGRQETCAKGRRKARREGKDSKCQAEGCGETEGGKRESEKDSLIGLVNPSDAPSWAVRKHGQHPTILARPSDFPGFGPRQIRTRLPARWQARSAPAQARIKIADFAARPFPCGLRLREKDRMPCHWQGI
jgi:hypothetical protein